MYNDVKYLQKNFDYYDITYYIRTPWKMFDIIMCSVRLIQVSIFHRTDLPLSAPNVHEPGHVLDWSIATANSGTSREEIRGIQAGESCTA